jgi:chromosomal replication initiator protein
MKLNELWQHALGEISVNVTPPIFHSWFKNSDLVDLRQDGVAVVSCHNNFTKEWLQEKCQKLILRSLRNQDPGIKNVMFVVKTDIAKTIRQSERLSTAAELENQLRLLDLNVDHETNLNSKYTFANFIVGSNNELAHAAAISTTEQSGIRFNPIFIYGGTGLGKTHLLHAIGNNFKNLQPKKKILYVTSEKFTEEYIRGVHYKTMDAFKEKYRTLDLLLIDDVQFLSGKEGTQEELFHTFNALAENNKQVVFSSDRPPKAIQAIEERLLSRFSGGMQADIKSPDFETRVAILRAKLAQLRYNLDDKTIEYIASKIQKNIRELEGALNLVLGQTRVKGKELSQPEVEHLLKEIAIVPSKVISYKRLIKTVSEFYDVGEKDLVEKSRKRNVVRPRQIAMYLLREELKYSFPAIGDKFGGRDHTTVMHACAKVSKEAEENQQFIQELSALKEKLFT